MKKFLFALLLIPTIILALPKQSFAVDPVVTEIQAEASTEHATTTEQDKHSEEPADESIVGMFGLNWKLFLAQLINFAIVLFVLWKWVWTPVTSNMEARTKKIEDSLLNADKINKDKEEFNAWRTKEMSKARVEATEIVSTAKQQAEVVKADILEKTKQEQQAVLERSQTELDQQKNKMIQDAKAELGKLIVTASEKLIRSKLDSKSDQKLINQALKDI